MKSFSITKVGYRSGQYGCIAEYFNCNHTPKHTKKGLDSFFFSGLYGTEHRIAQALRAKGYKGNETSSQYGRMTRKDVHPRNLEEHETLDWIKTYL